MTWQDLVTAIVGSYVLIACILPAVVVILCLVVALVFWYFSR
jgi:hypothetical protein